jgi:hypothetical protein
MNKFILIPVLALAAGPAIAENWHNVGSFTTVEFGRKLTIDVYGDYDSALRHGDFATLMVKGFGGRPETASQVTFECVKKEMVFPRQKVSITHDHKDGAATLPTAVMVELYEMACGKWWQTWKK